MNLTTRGKVVAGIGALGGFWAITFRLDGLNAVVIGAVVSLVIGALVVRQTEVPTVERVQPEPGHVDEPRTVRVRIDGPPGAVGTVIDELPVDVETEDGVKRREVALDGSPVEYRVVPGRRGVHELGPLQVEIRDPFSLLQREHRIEETVDLVTYPKVYDLVGLTGIPFFQQGGLSRERHEFDRVREYDSSDALRDIHWRSTAKRPPDQLIVKEFVARTEAGQARIVGESEVGGTDEMATAVASIAMSLLDEGLEVGIILPDREVPIDGGHGHRREILEALARTEGGQLVGDPTGSALRVSAGKGGDVQLDIGDRSMPFDRLRAQPPSPVASEREHGGTRAITDGGRQR